MVILKYILLLFGSYCLSVSAQNLPAYLHSIDPVPGVDFRSDKGSNIWSIDSLLFIVSGYVNDKDGRTVEFFVINANNKSILNYLLIEGPHNDLAVPSQGAYKICSDGDVIVVGEWFDMEKSRMQLCIAKISSSLDIEWINFYTELSSNNIYGYGVAETENREILISMTELVSQDPFIIDLKILKINLEGEIIWSKIIPDTFNTVGPFGDLTSTDDGNFIINATTVDFVHHPSTPWNTIVHKIDSTGEVIWTRVMDYVAFLRQEGLTTMIANGGAAVSWRKDTTWFDWITVNNEFPVLYGLDREGKICWRHEWYDVSIRSVNRIITARNGDILGVGVYQKEGSKGRAWLFRVSPDGEVLWERHYSDSLIRPWSPHLEILDLCEMDDGRIAATGIVFDTNEVGQINPNIGLLVVDSNGCITPNCDGLLHYVTGIHDYLSGYPHNLRVITCTPNPAIDRFRVSVIEAFKSQKHNFEIHIFDQLGMLIYLSPWEAGMINKEIDCLNWAQGLYCILLVEHGIPIASSKITIIR